MRTQSAAGSVKGSARDSRLQLPASSSRGSSTRPDEPLFTRRAVALLALILCIGGACRVLLVANSPAFIITGDTASYMAPAAELVENGTFTILYKRPPAYSLFLAGIVALGGPSFEVAAAAQHVLGLVGVVLVYVLGALVVGRGAGLIAALGVAVSGVVLRMEHTVLAESLFSLMLLASILCVLLACRTLASHRSVNLSRPTGLLLLLTGLLVGLLALTRPSGQMVLTLAVGAVLVSRGAWQARVLAIGLLGLGYGLVVGPWLLRNSTAHGVATLAGGLGESLVERTRRHDPTFDFRDHGAPPADARRAEIRRATFALAAHDPGSRAGHIRRALVERFNLSEAESDEALKDAALVVIKQEPLRYVRGTVEMFARLGLDQGSEHSLEEDWRTRADRGELERYARELRPQLMAERPPTESRARVEQLLGFFRDRQAGVSVAVLFLLGTISCVRRPGGSEAMVIPLMVVIHLLAYAALDGPHTRYRHPVQPLITLVAAGGLTWLMREAVRRLRPWLARRAPRGRGDAEPRPAAVLSGILPGRPAASPGQLKD